MFRMWGRIFTKNHMIKDCVVVVADPELSRTKKVFKALEEICHEFDLSVPIWLNSNIKDFQQTSKTRFTKDSFVEEIDFDYLEMLVLEED